jgi:hypothetical protein
MAHLCFVRATMTPFYQTASLLLSVARQQNLQIIGGTFQSLLTYHQHVFSVMDQHNETGGITLCKQF